MNSLNIFKLKLDNWIRFWQIVIYALNLWWREEEVCVINYVNIN